MSLIYFLYSYSPFTLFIEKNGNNNDSDFISTVRYKFYEFIQSDYSFSSEANYKSAGTQVFKMVPMIFQNRRDHFKNRRDKF